MKTSFQTLAFASSIVVAVNSWADSATSANVMAPLEVSNWGEFESQLNTAKSIGVTGVSVDVWWGKVESAGDQQFDWSYYDTIFTKISNAGLHIVPIMSFHQCGGNVGDTCDIPIPGWIWNHYAGQGVSASDLKYKSEYGNESVETVSLWRDDYVLDEYKEFMEAFEAHFAGMANVIDEINISMGPAGELRYPSYNGHDNGLTGYPTRGGFQSYSEPAKADFRDWAIAKYGSVAGVSASWGFTLNSMNDINPPSNAGSFISSGEQYNTQYGRDFIRWYHDSLMDHGYRMLDNALLAFDGSFANIELGFKIPGIHWKMSATDNTVRSAEMAAGLIPSDVDV
ncbi:MAG: family 14 glycosylhydrolase, partial [Reinekea sp.]|nr:family 14 glycosylhydrolase [Reinekea sp.]